MDHLKKAISMKTGRTAMLPPSIYNNPNRMQSGGWVIIETPPAPKVEPTTTTAPEESFLNTFTAQTETEAEPKKRTRKPKQTENE